MQKQPMIENDIVHIILKAFPQTFSMIKTPYAAEHTEVYAYSTCFKYKKNVMAQRIGPEQPQ